MKGILKKYSTFKFESEIVPNPVKYSMIFPEEYDESNTKFPLLLYLHGGSGDEKSIGFIEPLIRKLLKIREKSLKAKEEPLRKEN